MPERGHMTCNGQVQHKPMFPSRPVLCVWYANEVSFATTSVAHTLGPYARLGQKVFIMH